VVRSPAMAADPWADFLGKRCGRDDRLEIRRLLGQGGIGAVFEAVDTVEGTAYAIKFLHASWVNDPELIHRFRNEGTRWKEIRHPNLVRIHGLGRQFGMPFILSEMVSGRALEDILATEGALPPPEALRLAREIAAGLAEIHRHDIVHRDLKPANVLVEDPSRRARILDFGMAKYVSTNSMLTRPGEVLGTVGYMAPEQIAARAIDHRVDIFALGVLLVEMLTGGNAFLGNSNKEVMLSTMKGRLNGRERLRAIGGRDLEKQVDRLIHPDPDRRPRDMDAAMAALDEAAQAVAAGPGTGGLLGFLRRGRRAATERE
jgi:serine/threonine protein kinase